MIRGAVMLDNRDPFRRPRQERSGAEPAQHDLAAVTSPLNFPQLPLHPVDSTRHGAGEDRRTPATLIRASGQPLGVASLPRELGSEASALLAAPTRTERYDRSNSLLEAVTIKAPTPELYIRIASELNWGLNEGVARRIYNAARLAERLDLEEIEPSQINSANIDIACIDEISIRNGAVERSRRYALLQSVKNPDEGVFDDLHYHELSLISVVEGPEKGTFRLELRWNLVAALRLGILNGSWEDVGALASHDILPTMPESFDRCGAHTVAQNITVALRSIEELESECERGLELRKDGLSRDNSVPFGVVVKDVWPTQLELCGAATGILLSKSLAEALMAAAKDGAELSSSLLASLAEFDTELTLQLSSSVSPMDEFDLGVEEGDIDDTPIMRHEVRIHTVYRGVPLTITIARPEEDEGEWEDLSDEWDDEDDDSEDESFLPKHPPELERALEVFSFQPGESELPPPTLSVQWDVSSPVSTRLRALLWSALDLLTEALNVPAAPDNLSELPIDSDSVVGRKLSESVVLLVGAADPDDPSSDTSVPPAS